jgi:hypothetical protein
VKHGVLPALLKDEGFDGQALRMGNVNSPQSNWAAGCRFIYKTRSVLSPKIQIGF